MDRRFLKIDQGINMKSYRNEIENSFSFLKDFGFVFFISQSIKTGDNIISVFSCPSFQIRLTQYHQELYLEFSKIIINECLDDASWITFHWLIEYLSGNLKHKTKFFKCEKNYDVRIQKQIHSLSKELKLYINKIIDFFNSKDYEEQISKLRMHINNRLRDLGLL